MKQHVSRPLDTKEFASDEDQVLLGRQSRILWSEYSGDRRRKVYVRRRVLLNRLNYASLTARDDIVQFVVNLADFRMESGLRTGCAIS